MYVFYVCMFSCLCFRYPSQHVYCSEQSLSGPGQSAGNKNPDDLEQEQDSTQHKVCGGVDLATFIYLFIWL